ncbi:MAG: hypothetical protein IPJ03_16955 [Ignavibacteriales bacterium]|nr:hypothetical protein [Ignavibacteriales bacterium]
MANDLTNYQPKTLKTTYLPDNKETADTQIIVVTAPDKTKKIYIYVDGKKYLIGNLTEV